MVHVVADEVVVDADAPVALEAVAAAVLLRALEQDWGDLTTSFLVLLVRTISRIISLTLKAVTMSLNPCSSVPQESVLYLRVT